MRLLSNRGLSLIEVILSLSLGLLILTLVYGFWHTLVISDKSFKAKSSVYRQVPLALRSIENDLMSAVLYDFSGSYPDKRSFKVTRERIEFLAILPDGINRVVYEIGRPDLQSKRTVNIGSGVKDIQRIVSKASTDDQFFLLRGELLLSDELTQQKKVKASQIIYGPFKRDALQWNVISIVDGKLREDSVWDKETLPQAIKLKIQLSSSLKEDKNNIESVLMLPQFSHE